MFCKRESLGVLRLTYVFKILIKFPPKKLRAVKVKQLNFLSENLKEIFPPQLPGRKCVTESSLGIVARDIDTLKNCFEIFKKLSGEGIKIRVYWKN